MNNEPDLIAASPLAQAGTARTNFTTRMLAWARTSDRAMVLALILVCLITRLLAIPASLWEWDDILFARAMHRFDLVAHSPHPPGFPVFVMLARAAYWVLKSEHRALVTVALIFGVLLGPALFYFFREVFRERGLAFAAALLTCFAPNVWVQGAAGRSDGPGLTVGIIALALALRGLRSRKALLAACIVFGLGMGVRVTLLPVVAPTLAVVLLIRLWRREWKLVGAAIAVVALAALCWYVPLVVHTTWQTYRSVIGYHAQFTWTTDSIFASTENAVLTYRLTRFFVEIWGTAWVMWTIYTLAAWGVMALAVLRRWRELGWLALAFVPFIVFVFILNTPLSAPLYSLPYIPLFTGLAACGLVLTPRLFGQLTGWRALRPVGVALAIALSLALIEWTYPIVKMWHREASPSDRAMRYLQTHLNPQRDVVIYEGLFAPHTELYLPQQRALMGQEDFLAEANLIGLLVDRPPLIGVTTAPIFGAEDQEHFAWTSKRGERRLRVLSLGRYIDAYVADVSKTRSVRFLSGWYGEETGGGRAWRWMSGRGKAALLNGAETMMLRLRGVTVKRPGIDHPPTFILRLDGVEVDRFSPAQGEFTHTLMLKPDPTHLWSTLHIETDVSTIPSRDAGIDDSREMGLQCFGLEWWPAPGARLTLRAADQFLGAGWYELERDRSDTWRWTSGEATAQLPPVVGDARLVLKVLVPTSSDGRRSEVAVTVAGQVIERFQAPSGWYEKSFTVPAALHHGATTELKLIAQPTSGTPDPRPLALQVYYLGWMPADTP